MIENVKRYLISSGFKLNKFRKVHKPMELVLAADRKYCFDLTAADDENTYPATAQVSNC